MCTQAISPNCLARYGGASVPRYTSYPTAPHFSAAVGEADYGKWLEQADSDLPLSVYVHVPFCRSMCWYCGCHTTITARDAPIARYLDALHQEIGLVGDALATRVPARHVHFGGGTPTLMQPRQFVAVMRELRDRFPLADNAEVAIEIDPRTLEPAMIAALAEGWRG